MAGVKKLSFEWLSGYAMINLSHHWVFTPLTLIFGSELIDLIIVHWFTCIFDLTIVIWLIYKPSRIIATIVCALFHLMNSRLFSIGMFPWVCLAELPLFYDRSWPRNVFMKFNSNNKPMMPNNLTKRNRSEKEVAHKNPSKKQKMVITILICYCCIQCAIPFSHDITKGFNNWTNGIYGYSWDMMVHAWDTVMIVVKIINSNNGEIKYLNPYAYTDNDRWTKHPDLVYQFAKCVDKKLQKIYNNQHNYSVYVDVWCSLNGRFQQRLFDPNVDILHANWSPFLRSNWTKPLLSSLTHMRSKLLKISKEILQWSNYTDVLFMADFPNMKMNHYISKDLENVTLFVIDGRISVDVDNGDRWIKLVKGDLIRLQSGRMCQVKTTSDRPSSYMYTFVNKSMEKIVANEKNDKEFYMFDIWNEISNRLTNYRQFGKNLIDVFFIDNAYTKFFRLFL